MSPLSECILRLAELGRQRRQRRQRLWIESLFGFLGAADLPIEQSDDGDDYQQRDEPAAICMLWPATA